jgi:hypothetical protein
MLADLHRVSIDMRQVDAMPPWIRRDLRACMALNPSK